MARLDFSRNPLKPVTPEEITEYKRQLCPGANSCYNSLPEIERWLAKYNTWLWTKRKADYWKKQEVDRDAAIKKAEEDYANKKSTPFISDPADVAVLKKINDVLDAYEEEVRKGAEESEAAKARYKAEDERNRSARIARFNTEKAIRDAEDKIKASAEKETSRQNAVAAKKKLAS